MKLLDFNLEIALKHPERVVFRDGSKVVDFKYFSTALTEFKVFVQNENGELFNFNENGEFSSKSIPSLKLLPLTKTYYYCVFLNSYGVFGVSQDFEEKEEMRIFMKLHNSKILKEHSYTTEVSEN